RTASCLTCPPRVFSRLNAVLVFTDLPGTPAAQNCQAQNETETASSPGRYAMLACPHGDHVKSLRRAYLCGARPLFSLSDVEIGAVASSLTPGEHKNCLTAVSRPSSKPTISDFSSSQSFREAHDRLSHRLSRATCCNPGFASKHSCRR